MTQEEKAKAYDEAFKKAKQFHDKDLFAECNGNLVEYIFPELAESEDERIRKELIEHIKANRGADFVLFQKFSEEEIISWLEKQGEKPQGKTALEAINEVEVDNQNCVKTNGQVEPKIHVNEWVVTDKNNVVQIKAVNNGYYTIDNGMDFNMSYVDRFWHKWTIQDAKDGDVLVASDGSIFLFAGVVDLGCKYYIALELEDETIQVNDNFEHCWESVNGVTPATKEQRDMLFQKMEEAGYEWDVEKKELRNSNEFNCGGNPRGI